MIKLNDLKIDYRNLNIVPASDIPKGESASFDDLLGLYKLCNKMQTICDNLKGVGLSAVQLGIPLNVCIVKNEANYEYLINCRYQGVGEKIKSIEGCLSIIGEDGFPRQFELERYSNIVVNGKKLQVFPDDPNVNCMNLENASYSGFTSIIIQHELDHADGILISNIGREIKVW